MLVTSTVTFAAVARAGGTTMRLVPSGDALMTVPVVVPNFTPVASERLVPVMVTGVGTVPRATKSGVSSVTVGTSTSSGVVTPVEVPDQPWCWVVSASASYTEEAAAGNAYMTLSLMTTISSAG